MQQRRYWMQLGSLLRAQRDISAAVTTSTLATTDIVSIAIASATNTSAATHLFPHHLGSHRRRVHLVCTALSVCVQHLLRQLLSHRNRRFGSYWAALRWLPDGVRQCVAAIHLDVAVGLVLDVHLSGR